MKSASGNRFCSYADCLQDRPVIFNISFFTAVCIQKRVVFFHGIRDEYGITTKNGEKSMFTLAYGDETDTKR